MTKSWTRAYRSPVFYLHPHSCLPLSTEEQTASGENPWERAQQISAKSGEEFISEKQQEQEKIQKLYSSDQQSCLCKGKSCQIQINDCVPFTLSSALCLRNICSRSLMEFVQAEVQHIFMPKDSIDISHGKLIELECVLSSRLWIIQQCWSDQHAIMYRSTYTPGSGMSGIFENFIQCSNSSHL